MFYLLHTVVMEKVDVQFVIIYFSTNSICILIVHEKEKKKMKGQVQFEHLISDSQIYTSPPDNPSRHFSVVGSDSLEYGRSADWLCTKD